MWVCTDTQAGYLLSVIVHWGSKTVPKSTASPPALGPRFVANPHRAVCTAPVSLLLIRRCSTDSPTTESRDSPRCNYPVNTSTHPLSSHGIKAARLRRLLGRPHHRPDLFPSSVLRQPGIAVQLGFSTGQACFPSSVDSQQLHIQITITPSVGAEAQNTT